MIDEFKAGLSRRSFMRTLGAASVAATTLPAFAALQQARTGDAAATGGERAPRPADAVVIGANENPLGPSTLAREAMAATGALGGRYNHQLTNETVKAFSATFGLKPGYATFFAGSSGPLDLALYSNIGPGKDLIVCEPAYEQGPSAGAAMNAKVLRVPLTRTGAHDVKAMVAASPTPGTFYICNPNNPTGTMTPKEDIVWLVKNKPAGSLVVVDEAYHHFSNDESSIDLVAADQEVMVLRTFSKIYGMAGLRGGLFIAKPDLQAKLATISSTQKSVYLNGSWTVSIMTAAAATASVNDKTLVPARRKINTDIRENVFEWMDKNGFAYMKGSQANFFLADARRPGREFSALMQQDHVYIGRTWAAMPTYVRVTIGTQQEMDRFKAAYKKAYETAPLPASAFLDLPFHEAPSELNRHRYA